RGTDFGQHDREVLPETGQISESEIDDLDVVVSDERRDVFRTFGTLVLEVARLGGHGAGRIRGCLSGHRVLRNGFLAARPPGSREIHHCTDRAAPAKIASFSLWA